MPRVSVLVPVWNGAAYLQECLDSVLAQNFTDYELLISDDCSTDGTAAIIQTYAARDRRIRWWRNPVNLRQAGNLNLCLQEARGEYVKFVFADDKLLDPSCLQRMVECLDRDGSVSLVATASLVIDEHSRVIHRRNHFRESGVWEGRQALVECLERNANIIGEPSLVMFRRQAAARGFDGRFLQTIDFEMWFHLLEAGRFAYIAEPLCAWRQHPEQQTAITRRTGSCTDEHLWLMQTYSARLWLVEAATAKMLFTQIYYLQKQYGRRAQPLTAPLLARLGRGAYAGFWLRRKLFRPFKRLWEKLPAGDPDHFKHSK